MPGIRGSVTRRDSITFLPVNMPINLNMCIWIRFQQTRQIIQWFNRRTFHVMRAF